MLFDLELGNIPLINLRFEFKNIYNLLLSHTFRNQFVETNKPIKTPYIIWFGRKEDFLTFLIQRAILGVESYLPGAVFDEAGRNVSMKMRHFFETITVDLGHKKWVY